MVFNSCSTFKKLMHEQTDRLLSTKELDFIDRHRASCPACQAVERQGALALSMLRGSAIEPELAPNFNDRVMRRLHVRSVQDSVRFWSPAFIGAVVAALLVLASLQLVSHSTHMPLVNLNGHEARRISQPDPIFTNITEETDYRR